MFGYSIASWSRAVSAIEDLGKMQYCFFYDRVVLDSNGIPIKTPDGEYKKEEVVCVDTLFSIKEIRDDSTGNLKYYEIMPSSIFLDQRESYFMYIPNNWREEVKEQFGSKKTSSYTFRFLLFLRYQFELRRRKKIKPPMKITWSPEEISIALKMPQSVVLKKKKRMNEILENAYTVAKDLDYLVDYERKGHVDVLIINHEKFLLSNQIEDNSDIDILNDLFDHFYNCRKSIDSGAKLPETENRKSIINEFRNLIKER